jgi:ABC-2 type transport system ATP-binding protein
MGRARLAATYTTTVCSARDAASLPPHAAGATYATQRSGSRERDSMLPRGERSVREYRRTLGRAKARTTRRVQRAITGRIFRVSFPIPMTPLAVEISNVTKRFQEHVAVRDLNLRVPSGAVYGLLGPNGAGKTTTIRMILNIIAPDGGTISIFGRPHLEYGVTDRIGYLPEERGLYKKMQVRRVLRFLGELKGMRGHDADRRAGEWLERLGLKTPEKDWGQAKIDELSRGMQQKVQFVAALLHDPDLVILDEPFSGLDPINAQALKDTVVELKRRGKTVIFSTHVMETAERMCDAVCIIARGEKVLDGAVASVKAEHGSRIVALVLQNGAAISAAARVLQDRSLVARLDDSNRAFEIELAPGADPQRLLRQLVESGAIVERFELVHPSLHQIFLQRVGALDVGAIEASGAEAEVTIRG